MEQSTRVHSQGDKGFLAIKIMVRLEEPITKDLM